MILNRLVRALKQPFSPLVYLIGRAVNSPRISSASVNLDYFYGRGYLAHLKAKNIDSAGFERYSQAAYLCGLANGDIYPSIHKLVAKAHGQLLQDAVCLLVNRLKTGGYFVEVGVGDGRKYSNTLMLERDFHWKGILAEPARSFHNSISCSRSAILDKRAVDTETGEEKLFQQDDRMGELSGLAGQRVSRGEQTLSSYKVETIRLDDLLHYHGAPLDIDYISIDTEGSELEVLRSLDFQKYNVNFFTIEHNFNMRKLHAIDRIMIAQGYRRILRQVSRFDAWYVNTNLSGVPF